MSYQSRLLHQLRREIEQQYRDAMAALDKIEGFLTPTGDVPHPLYPNGRLENPEEKIDTPAPKKGGAGLPTDLPAPELRRLIMGVIDGTFLTVREIKEKLGIHRRQSITNALNHPKLSPLVVRRKNDKGLLMFCYIGEGSRPGVGEPVLDEDDGASSSPESSLESTNLPIEQPCGDDPYEESQSRQASNQLY